MLENSKAFSGFSVDNLAEAKQFYGKTLGLQVEDNPMGLLNLLLKGNNPILIYPKENHEPASFTILNFKVEDIDKAVNELTAKGVKMEHYEGFNQDTKGISRGRGPLVAWFKDPSGNILSLIQSPA